MEVPSGEFRMSGNQRIYECCFNCGKRNKLYQNEDTGAYFCFSCEVRGCTEQEPSAAGLARLMKVRSPVVELPEVRLPAYQKLGAMARRYLAGRGITKPEKFGIVQVRDEPRVLVPYFGEYGRIIHWTTRSFVDDGKPKYVTAPGRHPLYVLPEWGKYDEVVFVEGVFDAIVHYLGTGIPTVALGGKSVARHIDVQINSVARGRRTIMLDPDALADSLRIIRKWGQGTIHTLPVGSDPADFYKEAAIEAQSSIPGGDNGSHSQLGSQPVTPAGL